MKKIFALLVVLSQAFLVFSQVESDADKYKHIVINNPTGLNKIFIFKSIDKNTEITYSGTATPVRWFEFKTGMEVSNVPYFSPENNKGYVLQDNKGVRTTFWVFDYSKYTPVINSITAKDGADVCAAVKLNIESSMPPFEYEDPSGGRYKLDRKFAVTYNTLEWKDKAWADVEINTDTVKLPTNADVLLDAPLKNTFYKISGDTYGDKLGLSQSWTSAQEYTAKAVKCKLTSITSTVRKDIKNENDRPLTEKQLKGSAPLDINFLSNPTPAADTYVWKMYKDNTSSPFIIRSVKDNPYTFVDAGKYKVVVTVSNQFCSDADSVIVDISSSMLAVPKVFTPNDNGVQDEFRVAYRSIVEFNAIIINRWGRRLFSWNDPAKGWDGKINGRPAAEGPYYYSITAKGADGKIYRLKGCVNLIR